MHDISCVISSCVSDFKFLYQCLNQINDFFTEIIIVVGEQKHTGENEDIEKINSLKEYIIKNFKKENIRVITFKNPFDIIKCMYNSLSKYMYWDCHARWVGYNALSSQKGYTLFLDGNEIIERIPFRKWLDTYEYKQYNALKIANYWYWKKPNFRAKNHIEDSIIMIKLENCNPIHIFSKMGRHGIFESVKGNIKRNTMFDNKPFIHHYNWVCSKEEMLEKVRQLPPSENNYWELLVQEEFNKKEDDINNVSDFIYKLNYIDAGNIFNIKFD